MKLFGALAVLALSFVGCSKDTGSHSKNIFGSDNRVLVTNATEPFSAIGKLDNGCTGTMIGKRLMLTAGHCIKNDNSTEGRADFKLFSANMINGRSQASATPVRAWVGGATPEQDRKMDWAIVELSSGLGDTQGTMAVSSRDLTNLLPFQVNLGGYSGDLDDGNSASVHWNCSIRNIIDGKIRHDCDATAGISGAPIFVKSDNAWQIVGLSVSEFRQNIPPPVRRDDWTEDFSNVGTAATLFAQTVEALLATVDVGQTAPSLQDGVVAVTFSPSPQPSPRPSPRPSPQPSPQPSPLPDREPYLPGPAIDPNPPAAFGYIPFQLSQVSEVHEIFNQIQSIHNLHWALIDDVRRFGILSRDSNILFYIQISNIFTTMLNRHVTAYNTLARDGEAGMSREYLYQVYVALKSAENQLFTINRNFLPPAIAFETSRMEALTAGHMSQIESIIFH